MPVITVVRLYFLIKNVFSGFKDNPLTFVVEAVYRCVVVMDPAAALDALKVFVGDHGQSQVKDSVLAARDWVLGTALRLIESILTGPDVRYSTKLLFLRVLADSEIASIDDCMYIQGRNLVFLKGGWGISVLETGLNI